MKFLRFILLFFIFALPISPGIMNSQYSCYALNVNTDSIPKIKTYKYPSLLTASKVLGINTVIWGFDRFIMKEDWAYINGKSIKRNFKKGFIWDSNCFTTNMFSHPFHGSLYYNSARSSGLTWFQSIPFVLGGSFMWEFFMESEFPSTNDLFATTFGGIALGEMSFRATDLLVDNRLSGAERVGREVFIGVLSPMRAIHRLITGESWTRSVMKGSQLGDYPYELSVSVGTRALFNPSACDKIGLGATLGIDFHYGELADGVHSEPYEWFDFDIMLNAAKSSPVISKWSSRGLLYGKTFEKNAASRFTLGAFQHFMYYDLQPSETNFILGEAMSFGIGGIYNAEFKNSKNVFTGEAYLNAVPLGAVASDYMVLGDRNYNWGTGYGAKGYLKLNLDNRLSFSAGLEMTHLFSWNGYPKDIDWNNVDPDNYNIQGDKSKSLSLVSSVGVKYMLNDSWGISFTYNNYFRHTGYDYFDDKTCDFNDFMLTAVYSF